MRSYWAIKVTNFCMPCSSHSLDAHYWNLKGLTAVECEFPVKGTQGACTEFSQSPSGISLGEFLGKQRERNSTRRSSGRTVTERSCSVLSVCFCVLINFSNFSSVILRPWVLIQSLVFSYFKTLSIDSISGMELVSAIQTLNNRQQQIWPGLSKLWIALSIG